MQFFYWTFHLTQITSWILVLFGIMLENSCMQTKKTKQKRRKKEKGQLLLQIVFLNINLSPIILFRIFTHQVSNHFPYLSICVNVICLLFSLMLIFDQYSSGFGMIIWKYVCWSFSVYELLNDRDLGLLWSINITAYEILSKLLQMVTFS